MDSFEVEALIKAKSGDNESFEILLKKYEKYIYMNTKDYYLIDGEKEDLIQEGMIGLLKGIKSFDFSKEVSFKTFVIMCMRRQIISALKNSNSKKNQVLNVMYATDDEKTKEKIFKEKAPNAEEIYIYKELMQEFKIYSEKHFSDLEKNVLRYLVKGYSYGEIADILNKSNKTIDNTYQRIKLKVKKWLKSLNNI